MEKRKILRSEERRAQNDLLKFLDQEGYEPIDIWNLIYCLDCQHPDIKFTPKETLIAIRELYTENEKARDFIKRRIKRLVKECEQYGFKI